MSIEFKEGVVCFADRQQWYFDNYFSGCVNFSDVQLNNIEQGDYIPKSELDTVDKYNLAVEVFGLFGFGDSKVNYNTLALYDFCYIAKNGHVGGCTERHLLSISHRKLTYNQLMAIGELKRLMNGRETICGKPKSEFVEAIKRVNELESSNDGKSLQAYEILKSLDYEFDSEKGRWYRKEWV